MIDEASPKEKKLTKTQPEKIEGNAFLAKYSRKTPNNELNFIGAVVQYCNSYMEDVNESNRIQYINNYNNNIFPVISPGKPISEYDDSYIQDLLRAIQKYNNYDEDTMITRIRHLVIDPCNSYFNDQSEVNPIENPLWGAAYKFSDDSPDGVEATLLRLQKSLDISQEYIAADVLLSPTTDDGAKIGLALMLCCGVRNNEAVGFNFGDLVEMNDHPGFYVLRLARTSMRDSNQRKAGGKTWNAPRRLPLISRLAEFLLARKDFLSSIIEFPYTDKNGSIFSSVDELPISCRRTDFTTACSASDLTRAGRAFLRDILKIREQYVSGISYIIQHSEYELAEKDPTTYILRRNFATHLYTLGFPIEWCQYYMGHLIEDEGLKRSDFNDEEYLYQMALLLERHPLNGNSYSPTSITIPASGSKHKYVTIENKELNDPISITIVCDGGSAEIVSAKSHRLLPQEVDIARQINSGSGS